MEWPVDNVARDFLVHILPAATWAESISNPHIFSELHKIAPVNTVIHYNVKTKPAFGGFKSAIHGRVGEQLFGSHATDVCLKQGFHTNASGEKVLYDPTSQLVFLGVELNCLGWGTSMMQLVYRFMEGHERTAGPPPFEVPSMRFVHSALAINRGEERDPFLLEEWINPATEGPFVKYIHNRSARPLHFDDDEHETRALFLSFCQHVQFYKTDKAAYISDFQGELMSAVRITRAK